VSSGESRRTDPTDFSYEVRAFYQRHPCPAPVTDLKGDYERWANRERRRAAFHLLWPTERNRDDLLEVCALHHQLKGLGATLDASRV
jgi:hypothetical protein